jgi:uncharacterized integral membrane protein (TIGR00698 family)
MAGAIVAAAFALETFVKKNTPIVLSPLVASVLMGALLTNLRLIPMSARAGLQWGAKNLLRLGIVLLGLQLSFSKLRELGLRGLALVIVTTTVTFFGTQWFGKKLGLSPGLRLLVATGFSICGASAVAAMRPVSDADDDDTVYAIALVTLCGSLAIALLPTLGTWFGFSDVRFGSWVGASVHDVAQTVATAASRTADQAREAAIVVKLTRVMLLAPLVAGVSLHRRKHTQGEATTTAKLPPIVPLFVVGFLAMIALNSVAGFTPAQLKVPKKIEVVLLASALVGLGAGVDIRRLRAIGPRPLILGLASWALIASLSAVGVVLLGIG